MASAIEATSPQPKAVASTIPSTSPMAQPVRQCTVALNAARFSEEWSWWSCVLADRLDLVHVRGAVELRDPDDVVADGRPAHPKRRRRADGAERRHRRERSRLRRAGLDPRREARRVRADRHPRESLGPRRGEDEAD